MVSLLLLAGLSFVSCSDDGGGGSAGWNTESSSLVGTTWKYEYHPGSGSKPEGGGLRFITASVVQIIDWEYEHGTDYVEDVENGTYNAPNGVIYAGGESARFSVSGNKLTLYLLGETIIMTRE